MPAHQSMSQKNIWVAAGDGDLQRVKYLIENDGLSPNAADPNTYTPMHAAASYGQIEVLEYLVSKGGDVNVTDDDNETPLYTVESVEAARWLVDHGARAEWTNSEGQSPATYLEEDFPDVSRYLRSLSHSSNGTSVRPPNPITPPKPSQYVTEQSADLLTASLMSRVADVMQDNENSTDDADVDQKLRQVVEETVLQGMVKGLQLSEETSSNEVNAEGSRSRPSDGDGTVETVTDNTKRPRTENS